MANGTGLSRGSLSSVVAEQLRESVLRGEFAPGTRLTEVELAERLTTSRGPVREALRQLELEGLVQRDAYRGVKVAERSRVEIEEVLIPIRLVIETFAIRNAVATFGEPDFTALEGILSEMEQCAAKVDLDGVSQADIRFHDYVVSKLGHGQCSVIWQTIQPRIREHFRAERVRQDPRDIVREHRELLDAIRSGDEGRGVRTLEQHVHTYPSRAE